MQIKGNILDLLDILNDSIITLDSEMNVIYANPSQATLWNLNREEMLGKNIFEVIPNLSEEIFSDRILDALSNNEIVDVKWKNTKTAQMMYSTIFPYSEGVAMVSSIAKTSRVASTPP